MRTMPRSTSPNDAAPAASREKDMTPTTDGPKNRHRTLSIGLLPSTAITTITTTTTTTTIPSRSREASRHLLDSDVSHNPDASTRPTRRKRRRPHRRCKVVAGAIEAEIAVLNVLLDELHRTTPAATTYGPYKDVGMSTTVQVPSLVREIEEIVLRLIGDGDRDGKHQQCDATCMEKNVPMGGKDSLPEEAAKQHFFGDMISTTMTCLVAWLDRHAPTATKGAGELDPATAAAATVGETTAAPLTKTNRRWISAVAEVSAILRAVTRFQRLFCVIPNRAQTGSRSAGAAQFCMSTAMLLSKPWFQAVLEMTNSVVRSDALMLLTSCVSPSSSLSGSKASKVIAGSATPPSVSLMSTCERFLNDPDGLPRVAALRLLKRIYQICAPVDFSACLYRKVLCILQDESDARARLVSGHVIWLMVSAHGSSVTVVYDDRDLWSSNLVWTASPGNSDDPLLLAKTAENQRNEEAVAIAMTAGQQKQKHNSFRRMKLVSMSLPDHAFVKLCERACDNSLRVRLSVCSLLGSMHVAPTHMLQAFSKKPLRELLPEYMGARTSRRGKESRWIPEGGIDTMDAGLDGRHGGGLWLGAFVHGWEDEFSEVRAFTIEAVCDLGRRRPQFAKQAVQFMVDLFNDPIADVRVLAVRSVSQLANRGNFPPSSFDQIMMSMHDRVAAVRYAIYDLLVSIDLSDVEHNMERERDVMFAAGGSKPSGPPASPACEEEVGGEEIESVIQGHVLVRVVKALFANLVRFAADDREAIYGILCSLGQIYGHLIPVVLVSDLFGFKRESFVQVERRVTDAYYIGISVLLYNARMRSSVIENVCPQFCKNHFVYFVNSFPQWFPAEPSLAVTITTASTNVRQQRGGGGSRHDGRLAGGENTVALDDGEIMVMPRSSEEEQRRPQFDSEEVSNRLAPLYNGCVALLDLMDAYENRNVKQEGASVAIDEAVDSRRKAIHHRIIRIQRMCGHLARDFAVLSRYEGMSQARMQFFVSFTMLISYLAQLSHGPSLSPLRQKWTSSRIHTLAALLRFRYLGLRKSEKYILDSLYERSNCVNNSSSLPFSSTTQLINALRDAMSLLKPAVGGAPSMLMRTSATWMSPSCVNAGNPRPLRVGPVTSFDVAFRIINVLHIGLISLQVTFPRGGQNQTVRIPVTASAAKCLTETGFLSYEVVMAVALPVETLRRIANDSVAGGWVSCCKWTLDVVMAVDKTDSLNVASAAAIRLCTPLDHYVSFV